jgi:ribosome-associated protein
LNLKTTETNNNFTQEDSEALIKIAGEVLSDNKAEDIMVLDLRELTTLADFFVVCNGLSEVHVKSLSRDVISTVQDETGQKPWRKEGVEARRWIVLDYVNVVVHIFKPETREHYSLEKMWSDAKTTRIG